VNFRTAVALCLCSTVASFVTGYFLLRKANKSNFIARAPIILGCVSFPLYIAVFLLPNALPTLFERLLGHSIWAEYTYPPQANGIVESETWLPARWWTPVRAAYFYLVIGAAAWALVNILRGQSRAMNCIALLWGLSWIAISVYYSLTCFPFCF
jgi:hypothetical protein